MLSFCMLMSENYF